ncbi:methionine ABC transporter permease [Bacillus sinesaloumensis]|uniref:methionine ABC transporter permease n=1 Tax=Litchfieldia sinesaloumensis TaxID=1926280 RepID=UPI000988749C|nr:methionine ABC transporter permease [Bacillus sinesaloumensis]
MLNTIITLDQLIQALYETVVMVGISLLIGGLIGIVIGITLVVTRPGGLIPNTFIYHLMNPIVNIFRSLPFIILLVAIIPFTRMIVNTSIGTSAAIVPLTIFIAPYIGRLVENSLLEVNPGIMEAADSMGATPFQVIWYFMLPEAFGSLILTMTTATIGLIGATAMAGTVGGGGIGDLAISYGYQRFDTFTIIVTVAILVIVVQAIQSIGNVLARKARRD